MVGIIIIAALCILIMIALLGPQIKKWIWNARNAKSEEVSQFHCTLAGKEKDIDGLSTNDTYDCVEIGKPD